MGSDALKVGEIVKVEGFPFWLIVREVTKDKIKLDIHSKA